MRKQFSKLLPFLAIAGGIFICSCSDTDTQEGIKSQQEGDPSGNKDTPDCPTGFTGELCDQCLPDHWGKECAPCNCSGHGTCNAGLTGDGSCTCDKGWEGPNCSTESSCPEGFGGLDGKDCSSCLENHYGDLCKICDCKHGECRDGKSGNGQCKTDTCTEGWDGPNCDECAEGWDGPNCDECDLTKAYGKNCTAYGSVTDQDGNSYKTVIINGQEWMAENYRRKTGTYYYPDNNSSNTNTYGLLYTWTTASAAGFCPSDWRLPTKTDFDNLLTYATNNRTASNNFLALIKKSTAWTDYSNKGIDEFGFGALPAGDYISSYYYDFGDYGYFWSSTESEKDNSYAYNLRFAGSDVARVHYDWKTYGNSVRCLKDSN